MQIPAFSCIPHTRRGECALKEVAACGEDILKEVPSRNCSLWREAHADANFMVGCMVLGGLMLEQFMKDCGCNPTLE